MITVYLRGGLGNQMFQYALGLSLAKKNNTGLILDSVYLRDRTPRRNFSYRAYDLGAFALTARFTALSKVASTVPVPALWLGLDLVSLKAREVLGLQRVVREKDAHFDRTVLEQRGNLFLYGHWQSEKYFADVANEVRAAFRFREELSGAARAYGEEMQRTNSVSLHVRRGDFVAFKNVAQMMGDTNQAYYEKAEALIRSRVANPHLFIFSDDIDWCREYLKFSSPVTYVSSPVSGGAITDLHLMSLCKHHITANSTFSWWGAWLSQHPEKIVVTPAEWYKDGRLVEDDLIPANWIRLSA